MALFRCLQRWSSADELEELRCVEYDLIEEDYTQLVESRGIYPGQDLLQIFAGPFNIILVRLGIERVSGGGGGRRLSRARRGRGYRNRN
jgi:hypothetical protein